MKSKILAILYWIWSLTWNGFMTILGLFVTLFAIIFRKGRVRRNGYSIITVFGGNWGGLSLGAFSFCGNYSESYWYFEEVRCHEFGHSLQGLIWGPLFIFVIGIPSVCRYLYYTIVTSRGMYEEFPEGWYDSAWFEGQATRWGTAAMIKIEGGKN